jgi:hypothetical protein
MGILDDAIREHLELKRKHGAASSDLERLEQEAFGPAERPGEPESDEVAVAAAAVELDREPAEELVAEAEEPVAEAEEAEPEWLEDVEFEGAAEAESESPESEEAPSPSEQARAAHPELGDTADHPPVEPEVEEPEPAEAPEAAIFDQDEFGDKDDELDLELELPEDAAVEHPLPEPAGEEGFEADEVEEDEPEDEDEDLLEETPDFLEDAPEGERLWFERGKPKDFDFDE